MCMTHFQPTLLILPGQKLTCDIDIGIGDKMRLTFLIYFKEMLYRS